MRSASRSDVWRIPIGSKFAASSSSVGGLVGDLGVEPAHDRGERHRPLAVRDEEIGRQEHALGAVERPQRLALVRAADDDPAAGELRAVERVQRAPPHVHDVVRHVDDVRDRPHAREMEARAEPLRRRADPHVAEAAPDVPRAAAEVLDGDVDGLRARDGRILRVRESQRAVAEGGDLAREPDHREQVGPVHRRA